MHLLIYTSKKAANVLELKAIAGEIAPDSRHEVCYTVKQLHERLQQPRGNLSIALMNISRREEMDDIVLMNPFLSDFRIVVILPDRDKGTISKAHLLCPRFLTYSDHDLSELEAVLAKMIHNRS